MNNEDKEGDNKCDGDDQQSTPDSNMPILEIVCTRTYSPKHHGNNVMTKETLCNIEQNVDYSENIDVEKGYNKNECEGGDQQSTKDIPIVEIICTRSPSPKYRENGTVPQNSPTHVGQDNLDMKERVQKLTKTNFKVFPFGKIRTLIPIICSVFALTCSFLCKNSNSFVLLGRPVEIDPQYAPVRKLGLFQMELCRISTETSSKVAVYIDPRYNITDDIDPSTNFGGITIESTDIFAQRDSVYTYSTDYTDCESFRLTSTIVNDGLWNTSRILVGFTTHVGILFTVALTMTSFWQTINLLVVVAGLFLTYLCQSFAFLFFDTTVCKRYVCYQSFGTTMAICSAFFWFLAGVGALWMYMHDRNEKLKEEITAKKLEIRKQRLKRREKLIATQWSILDFFRRSVRSMSDTDESSSSSKSAESKVSKVSL